MEYRAFGNLKNPFSALKRGIYSLLRMDKSESMAGYDAEKYWTARLSSFGFDMRGVGRIDLSHSENRGMYQEAKEVLLSLCRKEGVDFGKSRMLDVGCGTGFYARAFLENGGRHYLGIDITDVLFGGLKKEFPDFRFEKMDISCKEPEGRFDLVVMIDVTQHITNSGKFSSAMQNLRLHLNEDGIFIVTSWLKDGVCSYYEISRPLSAYEKEFPGYSFSEPVPFRDKSIFSIRKRR